jgi:hypothetical protein
MDTFLLSAAIKSYEKTLKVLVSSSRCLITGGMVTDVLHSRNVIQEALDLEVDQTSAYARANAPPADKLLQKLDQLDQQLREQAPRILAAVDMAAVRDELNGSEFRDRIVSGWWWYLNQDQQKQSKSN